MSLRQCLRCLRMKREVKRGGICDECRKLVPGWHSLESRPESKHRRGTAPARSVPPNATVRNISKRPTTDESRARTFVTIICSPARRGESISDWTLGFEGEVSAEQRRLRISALLGKFARVRVFVAKKLVEQFPAAEMRASLLKPRGPSSSQVARPFGAASQSPIASPPMRAAATPRLVKRVPLSTEAKPPHPPATDDKHQALRIAGPYLEEPES